MMRKIIALLPLWLGLLTAAHAQDVMIRMDGSEMNVKVVEITSGQVRYYRSDNPEGPVYVEKRVYIWKIKYANGTEDVFTDKTGALPLNDLRKIRKIRYSGLVELAPYAGFGSSRTPQGFNDGIYVTSTPSSGSSGVSITTAHGVQLMDKYFIGIGVGYNIESNDQLYIPVFTTFRVDLGKDRARPFLTLSLGVQTGLLNFDIFYDDSAITYGLWSNAMFGYRFRNKLYLAAGLTVQNARLVYNEGDNSQKIYNVAGCICSFGVKF